MKYKIEDQYKIPKSTSVTYSDENEIYVEENELAISNLLDLTKQNKINWTCNHYLPIDDMSSDVNTRVYLWQSFYVETVFNNHVIKLDMTEVITLPSGRGNLGLTYKPDWNIDCSYDVMLSEKYKNYEYQRIKNIAERYKTDTLIQLFNLIVPSIVDSEQVKKGFNMPTAHIKRPNSIEENKLYKLSKILRQNKKALDFHKCIFDVEYRESLFKNYCI